KVSLHASAIGKCILAHLPAEEQAEVIGELDMHRFTKFTKTDKIQLTNDLSEYRAQGFATSHQETHLEIECYGSVIYDHEGSPVAGVGVSVPLYRLNPRKELYVKPLIACCQRISRCLGGEI
ncbi:MAG: IclR family transcriptional regulator C-terminal domain-containing protein, partial [Planctomycetota bacterium]